jgi:hypothetical protein
MLYGQFAPERPAPFVSYLINFSRIPNMGYRMEIPAVFINGYSNKNR